MRSAGHAGRRMAAGILAGAAAIGGARDGLGAGGTNAPAGTHAATRATEAGHLVIVTASRFERQWQELPVSANSIPGETIRIDRAARTVPEALKGVPGVMVQKTAQGQGSPYLRGFTGFRTLFLIDGVRLNNSVFRDGPNQYWSTVDPLSLKGIELVKGPASVLYGSDAIGGAANALTASPEFGDGFLCRRRLYYRGATADRSTVARAEASAASGQKAGAVAGISWKDFGNVRAGGTVGEQPKTGYSELDWDAKVAYRPDRRSMLTVAHQSADQDDVWRAHSTAYGTWWRGAKPGSDQQRILDQTRHLTYAQYDVGDLGSFADRMKVGVSHQVQDEDQYRVRKDGAADSQAFSVNTVGSFIQFESPSSLGNWVYGAEYYHDGVDSVGLKYAADGSVKSRAVQGPVADDATYDTLGAFVEDTVPLGGRVSFVPGLRYTYAAADTEQAADPLTGKAMPVDGDWDTVVGSARLLVALDEQQLWHAFAGASQGYRAPNLSDLTRFDIARSGELETPAPDLDPERYVTYETGLKGLAGRWQAQAAYYYTDIRDMIVRVPTGRTVDGATEVTKKNSGNGYVHGVEAEGRYRIVEDLAVFGSASWARGDVDTYATSSPDLSREPIDRLMPPAGTLGLRWDLVRGFWLQGECTAAVKQTRLSPGDVADTQRIPSGGTPGYTVCEVRAGWDVSKDLRLAVACENVADVDYRIHGSGVNETGRNFVLSAEYAF